MGDADRLLELLWARFAAEVPPVRSYMELAGGAFRNDHLGFRTIRRSGSGQALFLRAFERLGWKVAEERYDFPDVHLAARYLHHPDRPRIFVSEIVPEGFDPPVRDLLRSVPPDPEPPEDVEALARWFDGWGKPVVTEDELLAVEKVTQYGAWALAFGRRVHHFTAGVDDVEVWQRRLLDAGVKMKPEIEGAPGSPLRQSATFPVAAPVALKGGRTRDWPYGFLEIAQRRPGFDGFVVPQARGILEMTRREDPGRRR